MNFKPTPQSPVTESPIALRLPSLGLHLDEMEQGRIPLSARQYRKAAQEASALIQANPKHPDVRAACIKSPALTQLLQNVLIEAAHSAGKMTWLHSMRF